MRDRPLFGRAHIEQLGRQFAAQRSGNFRRFHLQTAITFIGGLQEGDDLFDIGDRVALRHIFEHILELVAAAVAAADVVSAEQRALRAGVGLQDGLHGALRSDHRGALHGSCVVPAVVRAQGTSEQRRDDGHMERGRLACPGARERAGAPVTPAGSGISATFRTASPGPELARLQPTIAYSASALMPLMSSNACRRNERSSGLDANRILVEINSTERSMSRRVRACCGDSSWIQNSTTPML